MSNIPYTDGRKEAVHNILDQEGIDVIESPVKSIILSELRKGQRDFQEIVKLTGKSKSTVSKHLTDLRRAGLILERTDPRDRRKRYSNSTQGTWAN